MALSGRRADLRRELGRARPHRFTQRFEPFSEPAPQSLGEFIAAGGLAIEIGPPFDKGTIAVDDGRDPQCRLKPRHRQRGRLAKFVSLRPLDIGLGQQPLPNLPPLIEHISDGADRVTGFSVLDPAFAGAGDPDRLVIEIANDFPNILSRLLEHRAVIGPRHRSPPEKSDDAGLSGRGRSIHPISDGLLGWPSCPALSAKNRLKFPAQPPFGDENS
jgi:hypothetical protein